MRLFSAHLRAGRGVLTAAVLVLSVLPAPPPAWAQRRAEPPRLVVFIVIDQLRADYLTRFQGHFGTGGFRRLMDNGAAFVNAHFSYGCTNTGPGHATIATGRQPREHGIVDNDWPQGRPNLSSRAAVYDPDAKILVGEGGKTEGRSPRNLIGITLGDQMKLADRHTRVFTVAFKDRAAILLGGKRADGAYWFDVEVGQFVTSDWYAQALPGYVRDFNTHRWADRFVNGKWDRALPAAAYEGTHPLPREMRTGNAGLGPAFPHLLPKPAGQPGKDYYEALWASPFGHEVTFEMARRIVTGERLGSGDVTDFLGVSLSSFDVAGHLFGPESPEMLDMTVRTDRQIADFLAWLDRAVGLSRCLVVLTGDHGVSSAPAVLEAAGLPVGRVDLAPLIKELNVAINKLADLPPGRDCIQVLDLPWVRMDPAVRGFDPELRGRILAAAKKALLAVEGVANVYTCDELEAGAPAPTDTARLLAWRSYYPGRSGELFIEAAPGWAAKGAVRANHSMGATSDRHVPLVIMGGPVRAGRYFTPADPVDLAVTVAALLGIEPPPGASGRVLHEALDPGDFTR